MSRVPLLRRRTAAALPLVLALLAVVAAGLPFAVAAPKATAADTALSPAGHWEGTITLPAQELAVDVDLMLKDGAWSGDITIPAQGAKDLPLGNVAMDGATATFSITGVPGEPTFNGILSADGKTMAGDFTQGGQTFPFTLSSGIDKAARATRALEGLDEIVNAALEDWKTPGLGLAVVVDGQVVLAKGYGQRDIEGGKPVTPRTLFAIGSSTKAFTTFLLGLLVDEGKLDWDEPVADYLPAFRLHDEYAGAHLTPRDMVTHRSGLPRHDLSWYNNEEISRADLVRRLQYLPLNKELRETFQYNNLMFLTAGHLAEQLTGMTWEEAVRARILTPLGMQRTNLSVKESQRDEDHALPYIEDDSELRQVDFRPINVMGPAGSINSSAEEMAHWVKLHLGGGRSGGKQVIAPGTLAELHAPQTIIQGVPEEEHLSPAAYAMGWFVRTWRGHLQVEHGGNIDGFSALVTLFPRDGMGIVALVNKGGSPIPNLVTSTVADRLLDLETKDWIGDAAARRDRARDFAKVGTDNKEMFRAKKTRPSRDLEEFIGEYEHPGYGIAEVRADGKRLTMVYNGMTLPLDHWHYDVFNVAESKDDVIPEDLRISFITDERGRLSRLTATMEPLADPIAFKRLPARRLRDPEFLTRLQGDYEVPNQKITFSRKGNILVLQITGQPSLELEPAGDDEFTLKGLTGFSVKFTVPETGPATEAVFIQPNGVFPATRVKEDDASPGA